MMRDRQHTSARRQAAWSIPIVALLLCCRGLTAAESPPPAHPLLSKPGELLYSDDLLQTPVNPQSHLGKWELRDGALVGTEIPEENHGAVLRRARWNFHDAAVAVSFRMDGAKGISLGLINRDGHIAAVRVTESSLQLNRSLTGGDKSEMIDSLPIKLSRGAWHLLLLETQGSEVVASIDGQQVVFGVHEKFDVDKTVVRLTVAGESAAFKDLSVRAAATSEAWEANRAKLLEARRTK